MDIAQRVQQQPARHVGVATAVTVHIHIHLIQLPIRLPIHQEVFQAVEVVELAEVQNLAGLERVRQFFIQLRKCRL